MIFYATGKVGYLLRFPEHPLQCFVSHARSWSKEAEYMAMHWDNTVFLQEWSRLLPRDMSGVKEVNLLPFNLFSPIFQHRVTENITLRGLIISGLNNKQICIREKYSIKFSWSSIPAILFLKKTASTDCFVFKNKEGGKNNPKDPKSHCHFSYGRLVKFSR